MPLIEIEEPSRPVEIVFEMDGPAFEAGIPIHTMLSGFSEVQGILDKTYLVLAGRHRMTREERSRFFLRAHRIARSSFHSDIDIVFAVGQVALPFMGTLGPAGIWEYTKQSYEFLKLVFEALKSGIQPQYSFTGHDNSTLTVNTGTINNTFHAPVFQIAQSSLTHYQALDKLINEDTVRHVSIGSRARPEIKHGIEAKGLFELPTEVDDKPVTISCEIFDFNKFDNVGRLSVFDGQAVPQGEYRFAVIGDQDVVHFIEAMLRAQVTVTCLRETAVNPFSLSRVMRLQVISVRN